MGFFDNLFKKKPSAIDSLQEDIKKANMLAEQINTTTSFMQFVKSYNDLLELMRHLILYENTGIYGTTSPTNDLEDILKKRPLTERNFIDRYVKEHGNISLECSAPFFNFFLKETQEYIKSILSKESKNQYVNTEEKERTSYEKKYENIETRDNPKEEKHNTNTESEKALNTERKYANVELEGLDPYLVMAGYIIIEKQRASIGTLQRTFNIGFNRAARIMDELCDCGVVGEEMGTIPRKVLMSKEEFKEFIEDYSFCGKEPEKEENPILERIGLYNNKFDYMEGHDFEYFCAEILKKCGFYDVEVTVGSGDQGIDIIAFKDGVKYGIQCKCYSSDIGNKAVQEVYSGARFYDCHVPVVLTNRHFTQSAKELAKKTNVILWDRDRLIKMIEESEIKADAFI